MSHQRRMPRKPLWTDTNYAQSVILHLPGVKPRTVSLAQAVSEIMRMPDIDTRRNAVIDFGDRDGQREVIKSYARIEQIYGRRNFPRWPDPISK